MILLKADAMIRSAFDKTISVMGVNVEWLGVFMVSYNTIILPGKRRSLVISFDNRKVTDTIIEINSNLDKARLMCDNQLLENAFNVLLYIFGKWNQIKGLSVNQNYKQLKKIIDTVFVPIGVTVDISKSQCKFYQNGIQLAYEDVIQLILDDMRGKGQDDSETEEVEDIQEMEEPAMEQPQRKRSSRFKMGLWHKMQWESVDKTFRYSTMSRKERAKKRLGRGFYASTYTCPICGETLYMAVYPVGKEVRIETDEEPVYLARAYTCGKCHIFYTPRPHTLLAEGQVYQLDFDDDGQAYDDYIDLLGKESARVSNCNFNVYESEYEQKSEEEAAQEEKEREQADKEFLDSVCEDIDNRSDAEVFQINERMDADFYSEKHTKKYAPKIEKETKKRNLRARNIKEFFKEKLKLDSREWKREKTAAVHKEQEQNVSEVSEYDLSNEMDGNTYDTQRTDSDGTDVPSQTKFGHKNLNRTNDNAAEKLQENAISNQDDNSAKEVKTPKKKLTPEKKNKAFAQIHKKDMKAYVTELATMSEDEIDELEQVLGEDSEDTKDFKTEERRVYQELTHKVLETKQSKNLAQQVLSVKDASFQEVLKVFEQIQKKKCADAVKKPFIDTLTEWLKAKREQEVQTILSQAPMPMKRADYEALRDTIGTFRIRQKDAKDDNQTEEAIEKLLALLDEKWRDSQQAQMQTIVAQETTDAGRYKQLMDADLDADIAGDALAQLFAKVKEQQMLTIEELCPDLSLLSYDEAVDVYEKISEEDFLPAIKIDLLPQIENYLESLKKDECQSLVKKFAKDMDYHSGYSKLYLYNTQENPYPVENALYSYATLRPFEYPIVICDTSRGDTGKKGFVLTPDRLYYSYGLSSGVYDVRSILRVFWDKGLFGKGIAVDYQDMGELKLSGVPKFANGDAGVAHFIEALDEFISYLKEKPISREIGYLAQQEHKIVCCVRCGYVFASDSELLCPKCGSVNELPGIVVPDTQEDESEEN